MIPPPVFSPQRIVNKRLLHLWHMFHPFLPPGLEFRILCLEGGVIPFIPHPREVLLVQFSLYVHKGGLKPHPLHPFMVHASSIYGTWFIHLWQTVHPFMAHDSSIYGTAHLFMAHGSVHLFMAHSSSGLSNRSYHSGLM